MFYSSPLYVLLATFDPPFVPPNILGTPFPPYFGDKNNWFLKSMLVTSRLFGLTNGKSYLTNTGVKQQYRNDSILTPINTPLPLRICFLLISAPILQKPYSTKRPSLMALLGYMYMSIEINRGLPSFNSSFIASLQKTVALVSVSQQRHVRSQSMWAHSSFKRMISSALRSRQERSRNNKLVFQFSSSFSNIQQALFRIFFCFSKTK